MIDRILNVLSDNPEGLAPRQLQAALGLASPGELTDDLGTLIGDGRVEHADVGGVSVYRKGVARPEAPKAKAAPTSRMVPIALLDQLADASGMPRGSVLADIIDSVQRWRSLVTDGGAIDNEIKNVIVEEAYPWVPATDSMSPVVGTLRETLRQLVGEAKTFRAMSSAAALQPSPPSGYVPPAPWVASYAYDDGKNYAKVSASGKRWDWAVDDGGTGDAATLEKAIRIADAVRALS